ncbi:hypothetical protein DSECCO2_243880 [anaerobic digester metagenome]
MFSKINSKARNYLLTIISMLFLTDILVLLNVPVLREISSFLFFTVIPGLLILNVLRLNKIELIKKVVLSVGLSITFLMFTGLFLNSLYPFLIKPLSFVPVMVTFNCLTLVLVFFAYWRNKENMGSFKLPSFKMEMQGKLLAPLIFPIIFPLMVVLGTYLMNTNQNNIILMVMLFLIPVYLVSVVYLKDRVHSATYPFAVWMIGMTMILMHGLTSYHVIGRDVQSEFYCFQLALKNFHWNLMDYYNPYNVCLSVTILPVIYKVFTALNSEYIFKLLFGIIGSFIPLVLYTVSQKYVGKRGAFIASFLLVFQTYFIYILGLVRQEIAFLFFFLAVMVMFDSEINKNIKKLLFIILMISVVVSHYSTSYFSMALILPVLILPFLKSLFKLMRKTGSRVGSSGKNLLDKLDFKNFDIIIVLLIFLALWYFLVADVQVQAGNDVMSSTIVAATASPGSHGLSSIPTRDSAVLTIFGIGTSSVPNMISVLVNDLIFLVMGIGIISIFRKFLKGKEGVMEKEYFFGAILSVCLLVTFVVLPYISMAYGPQRLFLQLLIFLAPMFVVGTRSIGKTIKKPGAGIVIAVLLIIALFSTGTYLQYHLYGTSYSPYYEKNGPLRDEYFVHDNEIAAASWLKTFGLEDIGIQADGISYSRMLLGYRGMYNTNKTEYMYLYLGYANVKKLKIYKNPDTPIKIRNFPEFVKGKNKLYDSGGSEIFLGKSGLNSTS